MCFQDRLLAQQQGTRTFRFWDYQMESKMSHRYMLQRGTTRIGLSVLSQKSSMRRDLQFQFQGQICMTFEITVVRHAPVLRNSMTHGSSDIVSKLTSLSPYLQHSEAAFDCVNCIKFHTFIKENNLNIWDSLFWAWSAHKTFCRRRRKYSGCLPAVSLLFR